MNILICSKKHNKLPLSQKCHAAVCAVLEETADLTGVTETLQEKKPERSHPLKLLFSGWGNRSTNRMVNHQTERIVKQNPFLRLGEPNKYPISVDRRFQKRSKAVRVWSIKEIIQPFNVKPLWQKQVMWWGWRVKFKSFIQKNVPFAICLCLRQHIETRVRKTWIMRIKLLH